MDSENSLYQSAEKIHAREVDGAFDRLRAAATVLLLGIYYVVPWLRWDRGPNAPDQAVLIDFPSRRFYFFFIEIWPQEIYFLTGIVDTKGGPYCSIYPIIIH